MFFYFKKFFTQHPKIASHLTSAAEYGSLVALACYATQSISDPRQREIAWENFLDEDGYRQACDDERRVYIHSKK